MGLRQAPSTPCTVSCNRRCSAQLSGPPLRCGVLWNTTFVTLGMDGVLYDNSSLVAPQVRRLAAAAELPNKGRKDSQGICFLGKVKFSEFVKEHLGAHGGRGGGTPM